MGKVNLGEKSQKVYELLKDLEDEDRGKVVKATLALLGDKSIKIGDSDTPAEGDEKPKIDKDDNPKTYFSKKKRTLSILPFQQHITYKKCSLLKFINHFL